MKIQNIYMCYTDKEGRVSCAEHVVWDLDTFLAAKEQQAVRERGTAYRISSDEFTKRTGRKVFN